MNAAQEAPRGEPRIPIVRTGPPLPGHSIQDAQEQHAWIIDQVLLPCSPTEYRALKLLFEHANTCVPFAAFFHQQDGSCVTRVEARQARARVACLMSRLRAKLWALGLDIVSVWNTGYLLLATTHLAEDAETMPESHRH